MKQLVIAVMFAAAVFFVSGAFATEYTETHEAYHLKAGQTVWELAEANITKQDKCSTLDEYVYYIYKTNNWDGKHVHQIGEKVIIPIYKVKK